MEAASRKSGRVEKEKEGPPESLLAFYFYFFVFLFSFFYNETDARPDSPLRSFPFFVFSEISFFGDGDKDQAGYDFPSHLNFLAFFVFFPHTFILLGRRATWNAFRPS